MPLTLLADREPNEASLLRGRGECKKLVEGTGPFSFSQWDMIKSQVPVVSPLLTYLTS